MLLQNHLDGHPRRQPILVKHVLYVLLFELPGECIEVVIRLSAPLDEALSAASVTKLRTHAPLDPFPLFTTSLELSILVQMSPLVASTFMFSMLVSLSLSHSHARTITHRRPFIYTDTSSLETAATTTTTT